MKKITDLEKFALEHIVRPYQDGLGLGFDERVTKLPFTLDELADKLKKNNEWSRMVLDRIRRIKFYFPEYINHRLVQIIKDSL